MVYVSAHSNTSCSHDDEFGGEANSCTVDMLDEFPDVSVTLLVMVSIPDGTSWMDLRGAVHESLIAAGSPGFVVSVHDPS